MTIKADILAKEKKEVEVFNYFEVMETVKKAITSWKAMGQTAVVKNFKEEIEKL